MTFKLGLDIHGVIDHNPDYFIGMAYTNLRCGGEVHIITGISWSEKLVRQLKEFNVLGYEYWTHFFSIDDFLKDKKDFITDELGRRHYDATTWNKVKADYCREHSIDMHIDDSPEYLQYFSTPCMLYDPDPSVPKIRYQAKYIRK